MEGTGSEPAGSLKSTQTQEEHCRDHRKVKQLRAASVFHELKQTDN